MDNRLRGRDDDRGCRRLRAERVSGGLETRLADPGDARRQRARHDRQRSAERERQGARSAPRAWTTGAAAAKARTSSSPTTAAGSAARSYTAPSAMPSRARAQQARSAPSDWATDDCRRDALPSVLAQRGQDLVRRAATLGRVALSVFLVGNAAAILLIWGGGGADGLGYHWHSFDAVLIGLGRLTALLAGYLALLEVLLLARLPFLERLVGFDRLTIWHRRNGHAVIGLILAHVVFSVWGYAGQDRHSFFREYWNWLTLPQPGAARRRQRQLLRGAHRDGDLAVPRHDHGDGRHGTSPASGGDLGRDRAPEALRTSGGMNPRHRPRWGIVTLLVPLIPAGNELVIDRVAADDWRALFALALALPLVPPCPTARAGRAPRPARRRA